MICWKAKSRVLNRTCVPAFLNTWLPRLPEFSPTDTQNLYSNYNKNIYAVWHSSARIWRGKGKSGITSSWELTWTSQLAEKYTSSSAALSRLLDRQKRNQKSINGQKRQRPGGEKGARVNMVSGCRRKVTASLQRKLFLRRERRYLAA